MPIKKDRPLFRLVFLCCISQYYIMEALLMYAHFQLQIEKQYQKGQMNI